MTLAILVVAGYLAGSIPFGYWLVRAFKGVDIRTQGSGNIGGTNVWRVVRPLVRAARRAPRHRRRASRRRCVATLVHGHLAGVLAGGAAMLGHWRPLFMGFKKGGKIVATTGGAFLGVAPVVGGIGAGIWILIFLLSRYASLASIVAGLTLPALAAALGYPWPVIAFAGAAAAAIVVLHRANIHRLLAGTESRATLRRRRRSTGSAGPSSTPAG